MMAVTTESPDAGDVASTPDTGPVQTGVSVWAPLCQPLAAGVWPRRKEAARGQTLCQLIVQRVGRAGGRVACLGAKRLAKTHTLLAFWQGQAAK
ncbi:hypothetical protein VZT92_027763 [Zoarces viviparus]|uniref:Uncharacterized protein n=1 Tax=Zoarces viviparus TaxID=48416 RepID=A0AAW1DVI8_ZOAVI